MINIKEKEECCGCSACVQKCPKQCISLHEDTEGFWYPIVNVKSCINCGLCEKVCPLLDHKEKIYPQKVLAVKNPREDVRTASSSGGVFLPLAREIINQGGVVFGAVFDECWEVHHVYAEKIEDVYPMMGSKYLQSRIDNTYKEAEQFLKHGRKVLYVGSPCQITGLRTFLQNKEYPNLLAVDFLCHGVPSPGVWRKYLAETYSGYSAGIKSRRQATAGKNTVLLSSLNAKSPIGDIKFRDKVESGWKKYRFVIHTKSASKANRNSVLSSDIHYNNPFMRGFLSDIYLRPSCYECKCKNGVSHSDLTIGDYWAARTVDQEFDDDKGISLVLVNTDKGHDYLKRLHMVVLPTTLEKAKLYNGGFSEYVHKHSNRGRFFDLINSKCTIEEAVAKCLRITRRRKLINVIEGKCCKLSRKMKSRLLGKLN